MKEYNQANIPLAKALRKNMTPWERKLWYEYLRTYPVRFQRKKAIGNYIVDFYCAKAQLVIELDGGGHYKPEQKQADDQRTRLLQEMGLKVVRICNLDIDKNFRGVCEHIDTMAQSSLPQSASLTAPSSEGAAADCRRQGTIYALGFFDGVHLGHQALLSACCRLAREQGCKAAAVTFSSHPDTLVLGKTPRLINSIEDRVRLLKEAGMDHVVVLPFDEAMQHMPWEDFLALLREKHDAAGLVCGHDFRFGNKGAGNAARMAAFCRDNAMACAVVPEQKIDGVTVSSTHIRALLEEGDVESAMRFLGHPHELSGQVVSGRQLGRTLGIPTANILIPEGVTVLRHGVYACKAQMEEKTYLAVTNVGNRPTVGGHRVTVEPWLLDFSGDLYGKTITLHFHHFLRPEEKFDSLDVLKAQIQKDAAETYKRLR